MCADTNTCRRVCIHTAQLASKFTVKHVLSHVPSQICIKVGEYWHMHEPCMIVFNVCECYTRIFNARKRCTSVFNTRECSQRDLSLHVQA